MNDFCMFLAPGRLWLECLITPPSCVTSTTNQESRLVLLSKVERHRKVTGTDARSLHAVWASPHDFFQRAINEFKTHLWKHLCKYPHWRTWEQKVPRAVSKISLWLTFGYGSRELWNPNSMLCCPSPGTACTSLPHQLHQDPKLILVQKSVSLTNFSFIFSHLGANEGSSKTGFHHPGPIFSH